MPKVVATKQVDDDGSEKPVMICDVDWDERQKIREKAETLCDTNQDTLVLFQGCKRLAVVVTGLKKGVTLEEGGRRGEDESNANQ